MTSETEHLVFMYGTLKKKEPNHYHMYLADPDGVEFVGHAITENRFPLIIATDNNIPFLLIHDGTTGNRIVGEVYRVNDVTMKALDEFECYPKIYDRRLVDVMVQPNSRDKGPQSYHLQCWIYGLPRFKASLLDLPHYSEYRSNGDHNRPFKPITKDTSLEEVDKIIFDFDN